ncbi:MAG: DUF3352 domain-containing protein [Myxococcales bacterium]|nr:DUF3352 domain-containing protein [Myxococcales bacterium]MCB9643199.1 DUF3352 domain-containing protein [Myxococcales bacterium]
MGLRLVRGIILAAMLCMGASSSQAGTLSPTLRSLMLHVPARVEVVAWAPVLRRLPTRLNGLLTNLEKKNPMGAQVRAFLGQIKTQSNIDLLSAASLQTLGLAQNGAGVVTMLDIQGTEWVLLVGTLRSLDDFDKGLDRLTTQLAAGASLRRQATPVAGGKIVTLFASSPNPDANTTEPLAAYAALQGKILMVAKSKNVSAGLPGAGKAPDCVSVLKRLLQLPPQKSMANHAPFLQGMRRLRGGEFGALLVQNKRLLGRNSALGAPSMRGSNFSWLVAGLFVSNNGLRASVYADTPLERDIIKLSSMMGRTSGSPAKLVKMLHKDALFAARFSVDINKFFRSILDEARRNTRGNGGPKAALARFRRLVGMDLETEVLPSFTGNALLALLGVDPAIVAYVRRRPAIVPSLVEAVMLFELRRPQNAKRLLAQLPRIAEKQGLPPVKELKGVGGAPMYKIMPSPGTSLFLTVVGRAMLIALNRKALASTLAAMRSSGQRLFASNVPKVLVQRRGVGVALSVRNLYRTINQLNLGFSTRMVLAGFLPFLQGMELATFRFLPTRQGFKMDVTLDLAP